MAAPTYQSVPDMLLSRVAATPDKPAFQYPLDGSWRTVTWKQTGERVREVASGLRALGLADEERCAIVASTRYDWIVMDLGILCAGGATTTIYPSNTPDECAFIIQDSNTRFVFAENDEQVAKLLKKRAELPLVKNVITVDGKPGHDGWVITLADLEARGRARHEQQPDDYEKIARAVRSDSLATLIYTSGTTGKPKGVELTHDCWVFEAEAIDGLGILRPDDVQFLWLPLAHSFGKVLEVAQLRIGFQTAVDGRVEKLVENLGAVKPTFVAAVPRIFEKVYNKVVAGAKAGGGLKYSIFKWAFGVGREVSSRKQHGAGAGGLLGLQNGIADKLVFSKLKERFGGRVRFFISGSAPLSREMAEFFHAADILILEGYGLTETSAASFVNRPEKFRFGTVGPPLPGTELKIAPEDGEILIKSRGVMRGYHGLPEATAETLDKDGWLHTGDIGELNDGFLKITDRKKDLIKTSGGKYVAPQSLEGKLKALCPYVSQVLVHGNNRNFCSALVALDEEALKAWAKDNGLGSLSYGELTKHQKVKELIQPFFDQLNSNLASYESVKKFAILPVDMTLEGGELTPSLKVKRKVVETKYKDVLDGFYAGNVADV
ncbi:MAG: AMP-dependent synthetase/ligase [Myxococcaceae bacterium]